MTSPLQAMLDEKIKRHKYEVCVIADVPEYDEVNVVHHVENPIIRSLIFQHIDSVRELIEIKSEVTKLLEGVVDSLEHEKGFLLSGNGDRQRGYDMALDTAVAIIRKYKI